jgi:SPX domain protein involved in polyphosphate accumulation
MIYYSKKEVDDLLSELDMKITKAFEIHTKKIKELNDKIEELEKKVKK